MAAASFWGFTGSKILAKTGRKFSPNLVQSLKLDRKYLSKPNRHKLFKKINLDGLTAGHTEVQCFYNSSKVP